MEGIKKNLCKNILFGSSLMLGVMANSNASQSLNPTVILNNQNPSYLLAMANNLLITAQNEQQFGLIVDVLRQAATKGSADAQFRLANIYLDSEYVEYDEDQAIYWLEKAVAQNHPEAKFVYEQVISDGYDIGC